MAATSALLVVVVVVFLAAVLQMGAVFTQRRHLQNAADAAALAGAQELDGTATGATVAQSTAEQWAAMNVAGLETMQTEVLDNNTKIRVSLAKRAPGLLPAFGLTSWTVTAKAAARVATVSTLKPCVAPLGVQDSIYQEAYQNYLDGVDTLVALKLAVQSGDSGSNTGLLSLMSGNLADPIRYGACNVLAPQVDTKPGGTIGDVNNGLRDRLEAAIGAGCYTYAEVTNGANYDKCIPPLFQSTGQLQATAVLRLPVLATNIVESGSQTYNLAKAPPPQDSWYLLADFWIDGDATYVDPLSGQWQCEVANECIIYGRFLFNVPAPVNVWDESLCPPEPEECFLPFDPQALIKVVQLIE